MSRSERRSRRTAGLRRRSVLGVLVGAALAGCASAPRTAGPVIPAPPDAPREWSGRFSTLIETAQPGGRQDAAAGRFLLVSRPVPGGRRLEIEVTSPFGQVVAIGRREAGGDATLRLADGRTLAAPSLDALMRQAVGGALPIERLPEWLDDRFEQVLARDPQGSVTLAQDSGWRIEREPGRWALERPQADGRLRVVLVLDR